ncbi:TonB family protein [Viridibacterium curvum]|uniref:TonB C-terminal domain-containing protein n=1 Tax=Viridibacterium curvum TaxID=1101404 RepID=A0ABP9QIU4_9RHOO
MAQKRPALTHGIPKIRKPSGLHALLQQHPVTLAFGVSISVVAHLLLLLTQFVHDSGGVRKQRDLLPIVLVNAKHSQAPSKAQAIAQTNLSGGGNVDKADMPGSPLRPEDRDQSGDSLQEERRRVEALEARARALLSQVNGQTAIEQAIGQRRDAQPTGETPQRGEADEDRRKAMSRQEALVQRQLQEYAQRPRKNFISPSTRESPSTLYWVDWRRAVEALGTQKFPRDANGKPLYGNVLLAIEIDRNGRLIDVRVERSSGNKRLDEAAMNIVRLGSPYKPLPPKVTKDYDVLVVVDRFNFQDVLGGATLDITGRTP